MAAFCERRCSESIDSESIDNNQRYKRSTGRNPMAIEIERKFLVSSDEWRTRPDGSVTPGTLFCQGYIPTEGLTTVRVRIEGEQARLTIKGKNEGLARTEFEYPIPLADARQMLDNLCARPLIEKTRYCYEYAGLVWEIDVFAGDNAGLVVAEVELASVEQSVALPDWVGQEVSQDPRY